MGLLNFVVYPHKVNTHFKGRIYGKTFSQLRAAYFKGDPVNMPDSEKPNLCA